MAGSTADSPSEHPARAYNDYAYGIAPAEPAPVRHDPAFVSSIIISRPWGSESWFALFEVNESEQVEFHGALDQVIAWSRSRCAMIRIRSDVTGEIRPLSDADG